MINNISKNLVPLDRKLKGTIDIDLDRHLRDKIAPHGSSFLTHNVFLSPQNTFRSMSSFIL